MADYNTAGAWQLAHDTEMSAQETACHIKMMQVQDTMLLQQAIPAARRSQVKVWCRRQLDGAAPPAVYSSAGAALLAAGQPLAPSNCSAVLRVWHKRTAISTEWNVWPTWLLPRRV